jgi:ferrous iron transport protein A
MEENQMKLCDLKNGEKARIVKIGRLGELKKRLVDMGVTAGEIIKLERNAPLGDPQEYIVKATGIAIRKEDAKNIEVEKIDE